MPTLRKSSPVVAVVCADVHLSIRPPIARADEPNWFSAMLRPWTEIRGTLLMKKPKPVVLCAGDIFDRWNSPPELINWAIECLPTIYAIPGNHDLPNHRPELSHRSAYGTLVRAGKIIELDSVRKRLHNMDVYGRPFGEEIPIPEPAEKGILKVLVTHEYIWTVGAGHVGAPDDRKLGKVVKDFHEFDIVVVGDNHMGFESTVKSTFIMNCGSLMRRKSNEVGYQPRVGLIHKDGRVSSHTLDTDDDVIVRTVTPEQEDADENDETIKDLIDGLENLEASDLSFREAVIRTMDAKKIRQEVRVEILEAMESGG